jgi:hypothetical protein
LRKEGPLAVELAFSGLASKEIRLLDVGGGLLLYWLCLFQLPAFLENSPQFNFRTFSCRRKTGGVYLKSLALAETIRVFVGPAHLVGVVKFEDDVAVGLQTHHFHAF